MKACIFSKDSRSLSMVDLEPPALGPFQVRIRVEACALCRTDLHVIDGDLPDPKSPLILGHEIVGIVEEKHDTATGIRIGDRVGVPWLASTCMNCSYCLSGRENLCDSALFTGYTVDGGFAEVTRADSRFCFPIPDSYDPAHAAPLLCAGLIGWRSLSFAGDSKRVGIYGFGAAAHVITPIALSLGKEIFAFTSPGDINRQLFARELGAIWAGGSDEEPPVQLDAAVIFAPVGSLVPRALTAVRKGGIVVCGGIHMSDIPSFAYSSLWGERTIVSVANLTRRDGVEFFELAARTKIETHVFEYDLSQLSDAISDFRDGKLHGAAVLKPHS